MPQIRLHSTNSVDSLNEDSNLNIGLNQTSKIMPQMDIRKKVDLYDVYKSEYNASNKYRVALTIKPYCTNVLHNMISEVVYIEDNTNDTTETHFMRDDTTNTIQAEWGVDVNEIVGKTSPYRSEMINDSEYSKDVIGFEYRPGYDIFNNHYLRSKTFRAVNPQTSRGRADYNTISDTLRTSTAVNVKFSPRQAPTNYAMINRHIYEHDNIMGFGDGESFATNLHVENGWYGFINASNIATKEKGKTTELDICHTINNRGNCDFIDLYPDRTLYSFNPKVNTHLRRIEKNWEVYLTYPYENFYGHNLVMDRYEFYGIDYQVAPGDSVVNGILCFDAKYLGGEIQVLPVGTDPSTGQPLYENYLRTGRPVMQFRTLCKHNLSQGDQVKIYYKKKYDPNDRDNTIHFQETSRGYAVSSVGKEDLSNPEYYFSINDNELLNEIFGEDAAEIDVWNYDFRFVKISGGLPCKYYIRMFKKIPNLKLANEILTPNIARNKVMMDEYVGENASRNGEMINFDCEVYPCAFSKTLYNDDVTQYQFIDSVNLEYMRDNLNRPISEIAATIVKKNVGYKEWYRENNPKYDDYVENGVRKHIEYSHCFGKITSGIDFRGEKGDDSNEIRSKKGLLSDIGILNNEPETDVSRHIFNKPLEWWYYDDNNSEVEQTDDIFFGDVVEFDPSKVEETVLAQCGHRFNTAQRELEWDVDTNEDGIVQNHGTGSKLQFIFQELDGDDFDDGGFVVNEYGADVPMHNEGYYYINNTVIPVKRYASEVHQASHRTLVIADARPVQSDGIYIKVRCNMAHGASVGRKAFICDDANGYWYESAVAYIDNNLTLLINPIQRDVEVYYGLPYVNWIDTCTKLMSGDFKLRIENPDIPDYAYNTGVNLFLWRDFINRSDLDNDDEATFPFANRDHLYIERNINFYLRRQDPEGINGLYFRSDQFPDIPGNIMTPSNYEYIPEELTVC